MKTPMLHSSMFSGSGFAGDGLVDSSARAMYCAVLLTVFAFKRLKFEIQD